MTHAPFKPVFHDGELEIQSRLGIAEALAPFAQRVIRDHIIEQHASFYAQLPMLNIGALDGTGQPWATASFGKAGFVTAPDEKTLSVNGDVLLAKELDLQVGEADKIGVLGLQPFTRRRNRLNGVVKARSEGGFSLAVDQSFGNCPQFIQRRAFRWRGADQLPASISASEDISDRAASEIATADTFFIASRARHMDGDPRNGVDVSHRGGRPGFIDVKDNVLSFPDFRGNNYFNTIGNIAADRRVGLMFPNFETGHAVFVAGEADVVWDDARIERFAGAQRIIDVRVTKSVFAENVLPLKGEYIEQWEKLEKTGIWQDMKRAG